MDSIWNSRSRRLPAPGTPFVYQPKCLRNSSAVLRVSPWSARARRACSSATANRSAAVGPGRGGRPATRSRAWANRSEEHTSELQSQFHLVCRLLLEKKKKKKKKNRNGIKQRQRGHDR